MLVVERNCCPCPVLFGLVLALALPAQAAEPDTTLIPRIDSLVERIGNPVIKDANDLQALRRLCDSSLTAARDIRTSDPAVDDAARRLYDVAYQIGQGFLDQHYEPAGTEFMLAAPGLSPSQRTVVAQIMSDEYAHVKALLTDTGGISPPQGRVVVLVPVRISDEFSEMLEWGRERIGAITALCKWVVTPVEVTRGSEMKEGYPQLREYLRHELTHVFVNSAAGTRSSRVRPTWFDEMVATGVVKKRRGLPMQYKEYLAVGDFVRDKQGDSTYFRFVREVVLHKFVDEPLQKILGYSSYEDIKADFHTTSFWHDLVRWAMAIGVVLALRASWPLWWNAAWRPLEILSAAATGLSTYLSERAAFRVLWTEARTAYELGDWQSAMADYETLESRRYVRWHRRRLLLEIWTRLPEVVVRVFVAKLDRARWAYDSHWWPEVVARYSELSNARYTFCLTPEERSEIAQRTLEGDFMITLGIARSNYTLRSWLSASELYERLLMPEFAQFRTEMVCREATDRRAEALARLQLADASRTLLEGRLDTADMLCGQLDQEEPKRVLGPDGAAEVRSLLTQIYQILLSRLRSTHSGDKQLLVLRCEQLLEDRFAFCRTEANEQEIRQALAGALGETASDAS
jgi:hypothetical protein